MPKKKTAKQPTSSPAEVETTPAAATQSGLAPATEEEMVVFAFRLTRTERDAIHAAAGSARASRFVRGLAVAAARGDRSAVETLIAETQTARR